MARIELRYCTITLKDGLGLPGVDGSTLPTGAATAAPVAAATALTVKSVNIPRAKNPAKVPVGARFVLASEAGLPTHVVTGRTQSSTSGTNAQQSVTITATGGTFTLAFGTETTAAIAYNAAAADVATALNALNGLTNCFAVSGAAGAWTVTFQNALAASPQPLLTGNGVDLTGTTVVTVATTTAGVAPDSTTAITFSPALGAAATTYAIGDVLTFQAQELGIKIGEGNCTYTEKKEYKYDLERGNLDAVREGNEAPVEMKFECVYEHITTGTGEAICPMDALKGQGGAAEWVSSDPTDPCQPYSVLVEIEYVPPCSGQDIEYTVFPDFRSESKEIDYEKAMISVNGKCNVTEAEVSRVPQ